MQETKRFTFRIPSDLFDKIEEIAKINHRSVNAQIITILEDYISLDDSQIPTDRKDKQTAT